MGIGGIAAERFLTGYQSGKMGRNIKKVDFTRQMEAAQKIEALRADTAAVKNKCNSKTGAENKEIEACFTSLFGRTYQVKPSDEALPIKTERYEIEDASSLEGVPAYIIRDKKTGRGLYITEEQLVIQRDEKSGMEFIINREQPFSENVLMTGELRNILNGLAKKRNFHLKEIPLQGGLTVNQDSKTGLNYLSIKGNEAKGVSVIVRSQSDAETIEKLADEFSKYSICKERATACLYALLEISGSLMRGEEGLTYLTPEGITYLPYDGSPEKAWESDINFDYLFHTKEKD